MVLWWCCSGRVRDVCVSSHQCHAQPKVALPPIEKRGSKDSLRSAAAVRESLFCHTLQKHQSLWRSMREYWRTCTYLCGSKNVHVPRSPILRVCQHQVPHDHPGKLCLLHRLGTCSWNWTRKCGGKSLPGTPNPASSTFSRRTPDGPACFASHLEKSLQQCISVDKEETSTTHHASLSTP